MNIGTELQLVLPTIHVTKNQIWIWFLNEDGEAFIKPHQNEKNQKIFKGYQKTGNLRKDRLCWNNLISLHQLAQYFCRSEKG